VKKNIYDLSCNEFDTQIAVVENQGMFDSVQESSVRLYDVGRRRDDEDEGVSWIYILVYNTIQRKLSV
jgi:HIV-1 Vpr-binding protein